jgi:hypothetical protein
MKRFKVLLGQRRMQVLLTMAVLLLAVSVFAASGASFTDQKVNAGNVFTAGAMTLTNDRSPGAILTVADMRPGQVVDGFVQLEVVGSVSGAVSVTKSEVSDPVNFGAELNLRVVETDPVTHVDFGPNLYNGPLNAAWAAYGLGTWAPATPHAYHFIVTWPAAGGADDNTLQGASCEYTFTWDAVSL